MGVQHMDFAKARENMVNSQIQTQDVTNTELLGALGNIARENFVPKAKASLAYAEMEVVLNNGRAMLRPREFAKLVQALEPETESVALVIGIGNGYEMAVMSRLVETVIGLDNDEEMAKKVSSKLEKFGFENTAIETGDFAKGLPNIGPFDTILVNGAVKDVSPYWLDQLNDGGRLAAIIDDEGRSRARLWQKSGENCSGRDLFDAKAPLLPDMAKPQGFVF